MKQKVDLLISLKNQAAAALAFCAAQILGLLCEPATA